MSVCWRGHLLDTIWQRVGVVVFVFAFIVFFFGILKRVDMYFWIPQVVTSLSLLYKAYISCKKKIRATCIPVGFYPYNMYVLLSMYSYNYVCCLCLNHAFSSRCPTRPQFGRAWTARGTPSLPALPADPQRRAAAAAGGGWKRCGWRRVRRRREACRRWCRTTCRSCTKRPWQLVPTPALYR